MAQTTNLPATFTLLIIIGFLMVTGGCKKDDPAPVPPAKTTYTLVKKDVLGVTGTVTFTATSSTVTTVDIVLTGAPTGVHPAQLCANTVVEGGDVVVTLNPVSETGSSSTTITTMTYAQLIAFDGFIKILKSEAEPTIVIAQGDIGGNMITATSTTYKLDTVGQYGVSGTALFQKRVNGTTLVTITITGIISGDVYPATINLGSISSVGGGPVVRLLNNVDGSSGKSMTNIRQLDSGVPISYDNWLVYDGYINIYITAIDLANIICHGNIGSN